MTSPTTTPPATAGTITVALPTVRPRLVPRHVHPRPGVLVVVSPDGFVEVFASAGVRVHIAERLATDAADEVLAERYLDARLPTWARELFLPGDLVAMRMVRALTASEEIQRRRELALVRGCSTEDARHA